MPEIPHTYSSTRNNDDQTIMIGNRYGHDDSGVILVNTQTRGEEDQPEPGQTGPSSRTGSAHAMRTLSVSRVCHCGTVHFFFPWMNTPY